LKHYLWREESHIVFIGYQGEGTVGRRIVDGAKTVRLFGEEIVIMAHIHTLGGFSAHGDQKGLLEWLSYFNNPHLEVIVNHGEEKISMALSQLIRERFHLVSTVPRWREKRVLFAPGETPVAEQEEIPISREDWPVLLKQLDRHYKRLRRKLKKLQSIDEEVPNPELQKELEEIAAKVEALEKEL
jgi:metallo-beta-lactamase family protein